MKKTFTGLSLSLAALLSGQACATPEESNRDLFGTHLLSQLEGHQAVTASRKTSFTIKTNADDALYLFTPIGENEWYPSFIPRFPGGNSSPEKGRMFFTSLKPDGKVRTTLWMITEYNEDARTISYARIKPAHDMALITVTVDPVDGTTSRATVRYDFTGLSESGNAYVTGITDDAFSGWIKEWDKAVAAFLANRD